MSGALRPRNLAIGGVVGAVAFTTFFPRTSSKVVPEKIETPGVQQIGDRFSAGGGTNTHTPAIATKRGSESGDSSHQDSNQEQMKGAGTHHFESKLADQKVDTQTAGEKLLNKTYHGSEKGR